MGIYTTTDLMIMKDFSEELEKKHSIKIEYTPTAETAKTLLKEYMYQDLGIREINTRLQQSSIGKHKVLIIENIERMTSEAANAFLKTCEEPLPKRLIIATTANVNQLLDTIISRAMTIKFHALTEKEMTTWMEEEQIYHGNEKIKQFMITMAMGKPGIVHRLSKLIHIEPELEKNLTDVIEYLRTGTHIFAAHETLKKLYKYGILESFIDGWIAYGFDNNMPEQSKKRLHTKKLMKTNVNIDNLLLY